MLRKSLYPAKPLPAGGSENDTDYDIPLIAPILTLTLIRRGPHEFDFLAHDFTIWEHMGSAKCLIIIRVAIKCCAQVRAEKSAAYSRTLQY